jgi:tRNA A-37 threonylcarbamoyl transferase component Bud32
MSDSDPRAKLRGAPLLGAPLPATPPPQRPAAERADPLVGTVLGGQYQIESLLGKGGAGRVYVATQLTLRRKVALKVLNPELDSNGEEHFSERFFREASLAGSLQHPNVVTVHDYGQTETGLCFIAMELLDGRSLKEVLADGAMDPERALDLFEQIVRGLRAAHRAGLVHRDVKPGNVLVCRGDDGQDHPKLLDFGLVKSEHGEVTEITRDGSFLGTPHYASPEQVRGEEADVRSDLYSVGVMLFRALSGKLPYASKNAMAIAMSHVRDPIPSFEERAPGLAIPPAFEVVVRRCMAKNPAERYPDADALLAAFAEVRRITYGPSPTLPPAPAPAPPPKKVTVGMVLLVTSVAGGAVGAGLLGLAYLSEATSPIRASVVEAPAPIEAELSEGSDANGTELAEEPAIVPVSLTLGSEPSGATVWKGAIELGKTPYAGVVEFGPGEPPAVRVEKAGFTGQTVSLTVVEGNAETTIRLEPLPQPAPTETAPATTPVPRPVAPAPRVEAPAPRPLEAPEPRAAEAPREPAPRTGGSGGSVTVDGVSFPASQVAAALRFVNEADRATLTGAGIAAAQATHVVNGRPYADLAAFGATYGVGPKTVEAVKRATSP